MTITEARKEAAKRLNYSGIDGTPQSARDNLTPEQQQKLTAELFRYIVENPDEFTPAQVAQANKIVRPDGSTSFDDPLSSYGAADALGDFGDEVINQAGKFGSGVKTAIYIGIAGALIVGGLYIADKLKTK
jgi:hypothetical protein